jgi:hypothetical protein
VSTVRISATYPATDGSMPESVEVEWGLEPGDALAKEAIDLVLDRLLAAPSRRGVSRTDAERTIFGGSSAGTYTAGKTIHAGSMVAFGPDGFTLYPAGCDDLGPASVPTSGVSGERLEAGDSLVKERSVSGLPVWVKNRETA